MSTPRQVFQQLSTGIGSGDWSRLHLLYAEDATVELPFARPAVVRLQGRTQVKEHFARFAGRAGLQPQDLRIQETADPELIVAEYDYEVRGVRLANIQVLRVRDGLIVESRDFHNHAALAELMS